MIFVESCVSPSLLFVFMVVRADNVGYAIHLFCRSFLRAGYLTLYSPSDPKVVAWKSVLGILENWRRILVCTKEDGCV